MMLSLPSVSYLTNRFRPMESLQYYELALHGTSQPLVSIPKSSIWCFPIFILHFQKRKRVGKKCEKTKNPLLAIFWWKNDFVKNIYVRI